MKLLIISGTPKTDGLTYSFVEKAEETAKSLGITFDTVRLRGKAAEGAENLEKCKMCANGWGVCFKQHYCAFGEKDGFTALQKKVQEANAFVYITPVYWGEMSEEMKIFIDKMRRCEATKQWNDKASAPSFLKGKPSIIVANAGGGGGGIINTFHGIERAIDHMGGDAHPRENNGVFDYIAVNRWNQVYKREALSAAITEMFAYYNGKEHVVANHMKDDYS